MELPQAFETFMQSGTTSLSNTICIVNEGEEWSGLSAESVNKLTAYGEVARVDSSLDSVLRCLLVTYFDVRSAQKALVELSGKAEAFRQGEHDFRVVIVNTAAYAAKVGISGGFNQFGEVANVSIHHGDAIVEYYDIRSAQRLIALAGNSASPCIPKTKAWSENNGLCRHVAGFIDYATASRRSEHHSQQQQQLMQLEQLQKMQLPHNWLSSMPPTPSTSMGTLSVPQALSTNTLPAVEDTTSSSEAHSVSSGQQNQSRPASPAERLYSKQSSSDLKAISSSSVSTGPAAAPTPKGNGPIRTKISNKDFAKFDINTDKIMRGEDSRTTVMVRNLVGPKARKDFLKFLEKAALHNRFTFFYMPCKEHRDVRAGFAFVNFKSAEDVKTLYGYVKSDMWKEMRKGDPQCKPLAMSYARFQGHDELMSHFSSSVVMHEQDPEKRPLFCAEAPDGHYSPNFSSGRGGEKNHGKKAFGHNVMPAPSQAEQDVQAPPGLGYGVNSLLSSSQQQSKLSGAVQELLAMNNLNMSNNDGSVQSALAALQPWAVPMDDDVRYSSFSKGMHGSMSSLDDSNFQADVAYIPDMTCDGILGSSYPVSVVGGNYGV